MSRLLVLLATLVLVVGAAACGGGGDEATPTPETVEGEMPTEEEAPAEGEGNPANGADVYASAGCGSCHILEEAGSTGTAGPNLDESDASFEEAVEQIREGGGGMPAFEDQLSEQEIADVAAYVTQD